MLALLSQRKLTYAKILTMFYNYTMMLILNGLAYKMFFMMRKMAYQ